MKQIIKSISLLGAISFVLTSILYYLTHLPVWSLITFSIVVQFLIHYIYETILVAYVGVNNKKIEVQMLKELSYQTADVECPCSQKHKQSVLLRLNDNNQYNCTQCNKLLSAEIGVTSTLTTIPVNTDIDSVDQILQQAKNAVTK